MASFLLPFKFFSGKFLQHVDTSELCTPKYVRKNIEMLTDKRERPSLSKVKLRQHHREYEAALFSTWGTWG